MLATNAVATLLANMGVLFTLVVFHLKTNNKAQVSSCGLSMGMKKSHTSMSWVGVPTGQQVGIWGNIRTQSSGQDDPMRNSPKVPCHMNYAELYTASLNVFIL